MWASGRYFDGALIERIQAAVDAAPERSRRSLSHEVCEWMGWRSDRGDVCEVSCRKALGKLQEKGLLRLPEVPKAQGGRFSSAAEGPHGVCAAEIRCSLEELGPVELVRVPEGSRGDSRVWNELMAAYHYLGAGPLCGAQIRYLIRSPAHGWLGGLAFSSATVRLSAREEWIGWSDRARRTHLSRVILNSRFLIAPTVEVPHLSSHVLGQVLCRISQDWQARYGQRPVLAETFVDPQRFRGVSYQAANWTRIGQSAGRKDPFANGKYTSGPKDLYVYPLDPDWKTILCREPARRLSGTAGSRTSTQDWVEEEFGRADLGDGRLRSRLLEVAQDFFSRPGQPIPEACGGSIAKVAGVYRLCHNPKVDMETLLLPHVESTLARIRDHKVVLAAQDTSDLNYTDHPATRDLGPLQSIDDLTVGLKLHSTMAFSEQGTPLGLLDVQCWARDGSTAGRSKKKRPIEDKESFKWIQSYRKVAEVQKLLPQTLLVSVGDREADIYELFEEALADPAGPKLLVRAEKSRSRKVSDQQLLWDCLARRPVACFQDLRIPRKGSRPERKATLAVRFGEVELQPPQGSKKPALRVWAVYTHEVDSDPKRIQEPLSWMLLTTIPTTTAAEACERVRWYARRWGIEIFHRTLKSGCRIEDRRLGDADSLQACLAIDIVVAWRIQWLTFHGREAPQMPCDRAFSPEEIEAAYIFLHRRPPPKRPPTLREMIRMVAKLGGFLGRNADGEPGTITLWRGLRRLADIVATLRAARLAQAARPP